MLDLNTAQALLKKLQEQDINVNPTHVFDVLCPHFLKKDFDPASLYPTYKKIALFVHPDKVSAEVAPIAAELFKMLANAYDKLKSKHAPISYSVNYFIILSSYVWPLTTPEDPNSEFTQLSLLQDLLLLPEYPERPVSEEIWREAEEAWEKIIKHLTEKKELSTGLNHSEKVILDSIGYFKNVLGLGKVRSLQQLTDQSKTNQTEFFTQSLVPSLKAELFLARFRALDGEVISLSPNVYRALGKVFSLGSEIAAQNTHIFIRHKSKKQRAEYFSEIQKRMQPQIHQLHSMIFITRELQNLLNNGDIEDPEIKKDLCDYVAETKEHIKTLDLLNASDTPSLPKFSPSKPSAKLTLILNRIQAFQKISQAKTLEELLTTYKEVIEKKGIYASLFEERGFFGLFGKYGATKTSQRCLREIKNRIAEQMTYYGSTYSSESLKNAKTVLATHHGRFWHVGKTTSEKAQKKMEKEWKRSNRPPPFL